MKNDGKIAYNAIIKDIEFVSERGSSFWITVEYCMGTQEFGGRSIYHKKSLSKEYYDVTGKLVFSLIDMFGIERLSQIKNKPCVITVEDGLIIKIHHFMFPERWVGFTNDKLEYNNG